MNLPGFQADASLYAGTRDYVSRSGAHRSAPGDAASVQPAFISCLRACCVGHDCDPDCLSCCQCVRRGGPAHLCCS